MTVEKSKGLLWTLSDTNRSNDWSDDKEKEKLSHHQKKLEWLYLLVCAEEPWGLLAVLMSHPFTF